MSRFSHRLQQSASTQPISPVFGWPDETNTGYQGVLTTYTGPTTITTAGTVISNKNITDTITIAANNVTISNCKVNGFWYAVQVNSGSLLIQDSEIVGSNGGTASLVVSGGSVSIQRCNIYGSEDGVRMGDNCTIQDSYVHGLVGDSSSHYDAVTFGPGAVDGHCIHNRIENTHDQTSCLEIGDPRYEASQVEVRNNFFAGGGYTMYAGPSRGASEGSVVADNVWSTKYFPDGGNFGPVTSWVNGNGNVWTNNTWYDGPNAGQLITP